MPFDDKKEYVPKVALKPQPNKSMFDDKPKKPTPQEFKEKVDQVQETLTGYKRRAAELFIQFNKSMMDKTLPQNRNIFNNETEREMLQNLLKLVEEINSDPNESDDMGTLTCFTLLLKTCLSQRDKINELEYNLSAALKKVELNMVELIKKEIAKTLDKKIENE